MPFMPLIFFVFLKETNLYHIRKYQKKSKTNSIEKIIIYTIWKNIFFSDTTRKIIINVIHILC